MDDEPRSPASKSGVRRPMNAFLIFCKRHRSLVRERNPRLDNRSVTRILGELWAKLPLDEKSTYTSLANEYKEAFLKANPDYKWFNPDKNTVPTNRDKPSTRPSNALTSYTGQIPHTDDNGPLSPTHAPITSQHLQTVQGTIPFSASLTATLSAPQRAPVTAQAIPLFPIGMATQGLTTQQSLSLQQPVTSITPAISTIAMVGGQPVMVQQAPLMVSLPQQQLTPVSMVTTHLPAINTMATTLGNQGTKLTGSVVTAAIGAEKVPQQTDRGVGLFELAQMCSSEHAKMVTHNRHNQFTTYSPAANVPSGQTQFAMATVMATGAAGSTNAALQQHQQLPQEPKETQSQQPRLDSKVLQGQVKEALGFHFNMEKEKEKIRNPTGINHVLDYSEMKNKEAEMRNMLRQDAVKSFGIDQVPTMAPKILANTSKPELRPTESIHLSKLVLDHVIEAMYSHESVNSTGNATNSGVNSKFQFPSSSSSTMATAVSQNTPINLNSMNVSYNMNSLNFNPTESQSQSQKSKLMLTFGEIQERVIRSAVEQSDYSDMLRLKSNPNQPNINSSNQSPTALPNFNNHQGILKMKDSKPPAATITSDSNKENKAVNNADKMAEFKDLKVEDSFDKGLTIASGDYKTETNVMTGTFNANVNGKESQISQSPFSQDNLHIQINNLNMEDCDAKTNIPIKKRRPRNSQKDQKEQTQQKDEKSRERKDSTQDADRQTDGEKIPEESPSSDDFDLSDIDAGVRKSKRSNRGRRYQELIQQGYLQPARDKGKKGDDNIMIPPAPMIIGNTPIPPHFENNRPIVQKTQFAELPTEVSANKCKNESEAAVGNTLATEGSLNDDQPYRKRTYSETDIGNRRIRKRYKTGDFDLDAQIASLPICHIDEVTRRGCRGKSLKMRHHSENSTLNKFAKPVDINLLNVAELRGVLRPRSRSMSNSTQGSARRKAPKISIVRFIQAVRNPHASVVPLLCPVSASGIPPWGENSTPKKMISKKKTVNKTSKFMNSKFMNQETKIEENNVEMKEEKSEVSESDNSMKKDTEISSESSTSENSSKSVPSTQEVNKQEMETAKVLTDPVIPKDKSDLQEAIGKVTCVNVAAVSDLRFEKGSKKSPALVTCQ